MIALWMSWPIEVRYLLLMLAGALAGSLANHVIYTFAYHPRAISPWSPKDESVPDRRWSDRLPILGWWGLRRESEQHGAGFWVRPLLIELSMVAALPSLYRFEALSGGLLDASARLPAFLTVYEPTGTTIFFAHAVLLTLMVAATFIDFDEKTIPDIITLPGTLIGVVMATWFVPISASIFMPAIMPVNGPPTSVLPTTFDSPWYTQPNPWLQTSRGWWAAMAIWTVWCFALLDRRWSSAVVRRRGLARGLKHFVDGIFHYGFWRIMAVIWIVGFIGITAVFRVGGDHWHGLFSSLLGLAVGGGIIWAIRIIASWALNVEAMGFGDVTLMAMIGAFVGWQAALSAFFLAPFAAIVIVVVQYIITRDPHVPFGPYLCAGTALTVLYWDTVYNGWLAINLYNLGTMLMWLSITMLVLMAVMLFVWRQIKLRLF